jgi:hypothetical protein
VSWKCTEEWLESVGDGGTVIMDAPSSVWVGELGTSRELRGPAAGLWGEKRPGAAVGERFWTGEIVSWGGALSSSAVRSAVIIAGILWSSTEGMIEEGMLGGWPL